MTASNLGIIFGPTLIKPRQADAEVSLSSLVDYPYQALMVELLVRHFQTVFDASPLPGADLGAADQSSPRLTPQEKVQRLTRHSTSMVDLKEVGRERGAGGLKFSIISLLFNQKSRKSKKPLMFVFWKWERSPAEASNSR